MMLAAGCHLGTKNVDFQMERYVWKRRADGIHIINLGKTWDKLMLAARIIVACENPQDVIAQAARPYGQRAVLKFAQYTGAKAIAGRHTPGTYTNQRDALFQEPRVLIVTDPRTDSQPVSETAYVNLPVIAFCDTDSPLKNVGVVIRQQQGRSTPSVVCTTFLRAWCCKCVAPCPRRTRGTSWSICSSTAIRKSSKRRRRRKPALPPPAARPSPPASMLSPTPWHVRPSSLGTSKSRPKLSRRVASPRLRATGLRPRRRRAGMPNKVVTLALVSAFRPKATKFAASELNAVISTFENAVVGLDSRLSLVCSGDTRTI